MKEDAGKIAIMLPRFGGGGAERVSIALAKSLRAFGYVTELWATRFDAGKRAELEHEGIISASPRDIAGKVRHRSRAATETVARMVRERNIDVLIIAVSPLGYMPELRQFIGERCRIVFHLHGQPYWELTALHTPGDKPRTLAEFARRSFSFLKKDLKERILHTYTRRAERLYRQSYAACDAYVVLCEAYKRTLERRLGIEHGKSKVSAIYNPVAGLQHLESLAGHPKEREVLFVGRLTHGDKRVDRLLNIWSAIGRPDWILRIVGDGPERKNLERLASSLHLENVRFEGYAKPDEYYARAYVFALTSTFEGWPGVLLEAYAAGCRPIAFACSDGVEEILDDGRGTLVEPFDENEYASKLAALMDSYPEAPEHSVAWLSTFTPSKIAAIWHSLLADIAGS